MFVTFNAFQPSDLYVYDALAHINDDRFQEVIVSFQCQLAQENQSESLAL